MKSPDKSNELRSILKQELGGNLARIKLLSFLISSILKVRNVNFKRLATGYHNGAKLSSKLRRIQRFFRQFEFSEPAYCRLLTKMLPVKEPYQLSLDRTNWKLGTLNINLLFLSVIYKGVSLPIFWCVLGDKRGNSSQSERIGLLDRFIKYFGREKIDCLTADREFVGNDWLSYLALNQIRFYIRVRKNMHFRFSDGRKVKAYWLLLSQPLNQAYFHPKIVYLQDTLVYFSGMEYIGKGGKIEYLIVVAFDQEHLSMEVYKKRWQIEMMFKAFKSSGFNLECTHINDYRRMDRLIKVLAISFIWAYNIGIYLHEQVKKIPLKKHGRRAQSFFSYGLDHLSQALINMVDKVIRKAITLFLSCT